MKQQGVISLTCRFVLAFLLFLIFAQSSEAATFVVTKLEDDNGPCTPDDCALREAVMAANNLPGVDRVEIPGGTYTLTIAGPDPVSMAVTEIGDVDILDELELIGDPANGWHGASSTSSTRTAAPLSELRAEIDFERYLLGVSNAHFMELRYPQRKAIHNLSEPRRSSGCQRFSSARRHRSRPGRAFPHAAWNLVPARVEDAQRRSH